MDWLTAANLILSIGLPAAEKLIQNWENKQAVTSDEFANLRVLAQQTAADRMKGQLTAAGIPLDDPHALALLALAAGNNPAAPAPPTPPQAS